MSNYYYLKTTKPVFRALALGKSEVSMCKLGIEKRNYMKIIWCILQK